MRVYAQGLIVLFFIVACNSDDDSPSNCGCESENLQENPITEDLTGKLFYKNDSLGNNYNNQKYWIVYNEDNCVNCIHSLIICNENSLSDIQNIPTLTQVNDIIANVDDLNGAIDVKFSGKLKTICNRIFAPSDYTYNNITITLIEQL